MAKNTIDSSNLLFEKIRIELFRFYMATEWRTVHFCQRGWKGVGWIGLWTTCEWRRIISLSALLPTQLPVKIWEVSSAPVSYIVKIRVAKWTSINRACVQTHKQFMKLHLHQALNFKFIGTHSINCTWDIYIFFFIVREILFTQTTVVTLNTNRSTFKVYKLIWNLTLFYLYCFA